MRILGVISRVQRPNAAPALCALVACNGYLACRASVDSAPTPPNCNVSLRCMYEQYKSVGYGGMPSCRMQNIARHFAPMFGRCGVEVKADSGRQTGQPQLSLALTSRYNNAPFLFEDQQTVAFAPGRFRRRDTDRRPVGVECGASTHLVRHTKRETTTCRHAKRVGCPRQQQQRGWRNTAMVRCTRETFGRVPVGCKNNTFRRPLLVGVTLRCPSKQIGTGSELGSQIQIPLYLTQSCFHRKWQDGATITTEKRRADEFCSLCAEQKCGGQW
jgi:hypothetical protein